MSIKSIDKVSRALSHISSEINETLLLYSDQKIQAVSDRVILAMVDDLKKEDAFIKNKGNMQCGIVLRHGSECKDVEIGDMALISFSSGFLIELGGVNCKSILERDIVLLKKNGEG